MSIVLNKTKGKITSATVRRYGATYTTRIVANPSAKDRWHYGKLLGLNKQASNEVVKEYVLKHDIENYISQDRQQMVDNFRKKRSTRKIQQFIRDRNSGFESVIGRPLFKKEQQKILSAYEWMPRNGNFNIRHANFEKMRKQLSETHAPGEIVMMKFYPKNITKRPVFIKKRMDAGAVEFTKFIQKTFNSIQNRPDNGQGFINGVNYDAEDFSSASSMGLKQAGGCKTTGTNTKKLNRLYCTNPKSTNNNCLINSINLLLKTRHKVNPDTIRNRCGIKIGIPLDMNIHGRILANYFNITLEFYSQGCTLLFSVGDGEEIIRVCQLSEKMEEMGTGARIITGHFMAINKIQDEEDFHEDELHRMNTKITRMNYYKNRIGGQRLVMKKNKRHKTDIDFNNIIHYDLETFPVDDEQGNKIHTVYAVSWHMNGVQYMEYGPECMTKFIDSFIDSRENYILNAYNGSRYDSYYLIKEIMRRDIDVSQLIVSGGILSASFLGHKVWDLCRFTTCKLSKACADFKLNVMKGDFNHKKIRSWADVETYRHEWEPYLMDDVRCLKELYETIHNNLYKETKMYITDFMTLSSMAWTIFNSSCPIEMEVLSANKYEFVRRGIYGGRTLPLKESNEGEDLAYLDVNSLYPTVMKKYKYPSGMSLWGDNNRCQEILDDDSYIAYYEVVYTPPPDIRVPILPRRMPDGSIKWDLLPSNGVYAEPDIKMALKHNYKIQFVQCLFWKSTDGLFSNFIDKFYSKRQENIGVNDALAVMCKLLMNSLYGKLMQRAMLQKNFICKSTDDVLRALAITDIEDDDKIIDITYIDDSNILMSFDEELENNIKYPAHIGGLVSSYARNFMVSEVFERVSPDLKEIPFLYTDTDSIFIPWDKINLFSDMMGKGLGQLKSETGDKPITMAKFYAPKLYTYSTDEKQTYKAKGIPEECVPGRFFMYDKIKSIEVCMPERIKAMHFNACASNGRGAMSHYNITMNRTINKGWEKMNFIQGEWYPKGFICD